MVLAIDRDTCTRCKACVRDCPAYVIEFDETTGPVEAHPECCISCGHCVAVCPVNAITHEAFPAGAYVPVKEHGISIDAFTTMCTQRRSTRRFKPAPVSREHVDKVLAAAATAPTGENARELQYLVVSDPAVIASVRAFMAGKFRTLERLASTFKGFLALGAGKREATRMRETLRLMNKAHAEHGQDGEDPYLRTATTLLIIHAKHKTAMATLDAGIAGAHAVLACETLGIGTCWNGFHVVFSKMYSKLKAITGVPKKNHVLATILMGYPAVTYKRTCARPPATVLRVPPDPDDSPGGKL